MWCHFGHRIVKLGLFYYLFFVWFVDFDYLFIYLFRIGALSIITVFTQKWDAFSQGCHLPLSELKYPTLT